MQGGEGHGRLHPHQLCNGELALQRSHTAFLPFGSHTCEMQLSNALNDLIQLSEEIKSIMYGSLYPCFYFLLQKAVTVLIKALYGVSPVTKIL